VFNDVKRHPLAGTSSATGKWNSEAEASLRKGRQRLNDRANGLEGSPNLPAVARSRGSSVGNNIPASANESSRRGAPAGLGAAPGGETERLRRRDEVVKWNRAPVNAEREPGMSNLPEDRSNRLASGEPADGLPAAEGETLPPAPPPDAEEPTVPPAPAGKAGP